MPTGWGGQVLPEVQQAEATTDASLQGLQEMCAQVRRAPAKTSKPAVYLYHLAGWDADSVIAW